LIRTLGSDVEIDVLVAPRASRDRIAGTHDDRLKVATTAPPVGGAANDAVTKLIAKALGVARSRVEVVRGHTSKRKTLRIRDAKSAAVAEVLP